MKISFENEDHNGFDMITIDLTHFKLMLSKLVTFCQSLFFQENHYGIDRKQGLYCNTIQKDWPFNPNTRRRKYNDIEYVSIPQHIPRELLSMMRFCAVLYSVRCSNSDSSSGRPKLFLPLVLLLQAESSASDFCCGRSLIT